jgi:cholesterol 7-dehydrogenase
MDLLASSSGTFITTGILLFVYLFYCFLVRPLNRIMKLGDLGFYFGNLKPQKDYMNMLIERMKKLRVLGDLPPVYPNGWYCVAQSSELKPKEIKPVIFMGMLCLVMFWKKIVFKLFVMIL